MPPCSAGSTELGPPTIVRISRKFPFPPPIRHTSHGGAGTGAGVGHSVVGVADGLNVSPETVGGRVVGGTVGFATVGDTVGRGACITGVGTCVGDVEVGLNVSPTNVGDRVVGVDVAGAAVGLNVSPGTVGECVTGADVTGESVGLNVAPTKVGDRVVGDELRGDTDGLNVSPGLVGARVVGVDDGAPDVGDDVGHGTVGAVGGAAGQMPSVIDDSPPSEMNPLMKIEPICIPVKKYREHDVWIPMVWTIPPCSTVHSVFRSNPALVVNSSL